MLTFGKMHVEGFASVLDETFYWDTPGLNIVKAPNGVGKSKFINALYWALYGKTLKGSVETWDSMKPKDYKGTKVTLNFKKGPTAYKVIRCKGYTGLVNGAKGKNRLVIEEDGVELTSDGKAGLKEELTDIIGYSADLFKNSIIFGQKLKRLVSESGPNKKRILDEAFDVMYISKAKDISEKALTVAQEKLNKSEHQIEILQTKVKSLSEEIERDMEKIVTFEEDKKKDIEKEKGLLSALKDELRGLRHSAVDMDVLNEGIFQYKDAITLLRKDLKSLGGPEIKLATRNSDLNHERKNHELILNQLSLASKKLISIPEKCNNCGKPFTEPEKLKEKERLTKAHQEVKEKYDASCTALTSIKSDILKLEKDLSSANVIAKQINTATINLEALEKTHTTQTLLAQKIATVKDKLKEKRNTIKTIKGKTLPKNFEELTRTLSDLNAQLQTATESNELLLQERDDYKWLITDPLSNAGLKAFIFDTMLENINERLDYYTKFSGMRVGFLIDMDSARKDVNTVIANTKGEFIPYEDLSGGQEQKVDIISVFAIHDVVSENKDCSLLIMDELFESLDKSNIELLTELIQDKAKDKCLYLITHRDEFAPTNANIITLVQNDGITSID